MSSSDNGDVNASCNVEMSLYCLLDNWHGLGWCEKQNYTLDCFSFIIPFGFVGYDALCDLGWRFEVRLSENLI